MKKQILFLLFGILALSMVYAIALDNYQNTEIPKEYRKVVGNQKINVYLDNNFFIATEIKDGKVSLLKEKFQKPTLEVFVKNETLTKILSSQNPQQEILSAYKSGEIRVVKKTLLNKLKFWFTGFFIR